MVTHNEFFKFYRINHPMTKSVYILIFINLISFLFNGVTNAEATTTNPVIPLPNQDYALCAGAVTFNLDSITYAKCRIKYGNSLGVCRTFHF